MTFIVMAGCAVFLSSCLEKQTAFHQYVSTPSEHHWQQGDTLTILLPATLPLDTYWWEIELRHTNSYQYRDLWLNVSTNLPDSTITHTHRLHLFLSDDAGRWYSKTSSGTLYTKTYRFPAPVVVAHPAQSYRIRFAHAMSQRDLSGIVDIGVKLVRVQ